MKIIQQFLNRFGDARDTPIDVRKSGARAAVTPAPLLMALEPRVVYDASVAAIAPHAHAHGAEADTHAGVAAATNATPHAAPKTVAEHDVRHVKPLNDNEAQNTDTQKAVQSGAPAAADAAPHAVVFIDPSVPDYQALIAGLPAGTQYVVLNATTDGFAQIAGYLQTHKGVDSIHLISHGADGEIQAGSTWLNAGDLSAYSGELAQIGAAIKPGGDFLIYGCDVAQNADGQMLVQQVAALTHLNLAASTDATGATALGGNWTLEYQVGAVHTPVIESAAARQQFDALLGVTVETYDAQAAGGYQNTSATFTLDGITYVTDATGPIENDIYTAANDPFGAPDLSSGAGDGTLMLNFNGNQMSRVTIELANGAHFSLSSFDLDAVSDGKIYLIPNGDTSKEVLIFTGPGDGNGGTYTGTVNLSGNPDFANLTSVTIADVGDDPGANFVPSLDNLAYTVLAPTLTPSSGSAAFTAGDNVTSTPVQVDSGLTFTDSNATTAQSATVTIGNVKAGDVLAYTNNPATMGNITGTYNSGTGVLSLSSSGGSATLAQWQAALDSVTFTNSQITPDATTRTINFSITDSGGATGTATRTLTVTDTDQTPIVTTTGGSTSYVAGAGATTIDSGVTVSDRDNTTLTSATVAISGGAGSGDILLFTNDGSTMGNITGSYDVSGHVLTLTSSGGTATDAQWQSALDHIQFSSAAGTAGGARTVTFAVNDGVKNSVAMTKTVDVTAVPVVTLDSGSASFVSADNTTSTPVAVDSGLTVADSGHTTLTSATVQISGNFQPGEDMLLFVNNPGTMGNISGSYTSATGVLSLSSAGGTATLAQWQAALRSITYTDSAVSPATPTRTVSFTVNDGANNSATVTRNITVTATDQTPIVTLSGSNTAYVAGSAATVIDGGINVTDRDTNPTLVSATVSITAGFHAGDTLLFVNDGFVTGSYNSATGVLTLIANGTVSDAQWQTELDNVKFSSLASAASGVRTVSYTVNDGTKTSAAVSRTVTVGAVPVVTTDSGSAAFVAGDNTTSSPVAVDSGVTVAETGGSTLASATVAITGNFHAGEDSLLFSNNPATMGDIAGTYDASSGILSLTSASGTATLAQWQAALRSVTYTDSAITPNNATRTISFTVNDGTQTSQTATRTVTVVDTDQTPLLTTSGGSSAFVEGDNVASTPVAVDAGVTVSDRDNATLSSASVSITGNFQAGEDVLAFNNTSASLFGNISAAYDLATGVLTMTSAGGSATLAQWQAALRAVTYTDSAITPDTATRTISFTVNDGTKNSALGTKTVTVAGTDQSPVLTASTSGFDYLPGAAPHDIDSGLTLIDRDNTTLASVTIQFSAGFHNGDQLSLNYNAATMGTAFTTTYDAGTGTFTINRTGGALTLANWQAIVDGVQFSAAAGSPLGTRTVSVTASDGVKNSATLSYDIDVISSAPTLSTTSTGSAAFTAGDNTVSTPVAVDSGISVADPLGNPIVSATVTIGSNLHAGEDVLSYINNGTTMGDITGSFNALTGVLTLTSAGGATDAQWDAALRAVTYTDTAVTPNTATRQIDFTISDGVQSSTALSRNVTVAGVDQTPILTTSGGDAAFIEGDNVTSTPVAIDTGLTVSDLDNTTLASAVVSITSGFHAGEDQLAFANTNASTFGNIAGSYDASTGVMTLTSAGNTATLAQWQAALRSVTYTDTAITPDTTQRVISFTVNDGSKDSAAGAKAVDLTATEQAPVITTTAGDGSFVSGDNVTSTPVPIDSGLTVSDLDNTTLASATVSITSGFHAGEDVLAFANNNASSFGNITGSYDASTGVMTLTSAGGTATVAQWTAALKAMTYTDTAIVPDGASRTISFTVNDGTKDSVTATRVIDLTATTQTPGLVAGTGGTPTFTASGAGAAPVTIDSGIAIADRDPNAHLGSALVSISGNFQADRDVLAFKGSAATGNISASYDPNTGVLTLTSAGSSATLAQWQAALAAVTYADTSAETSGGSRTISFAVNVAGKSSAALTRTVNLAAGPVTPPPAEPPPPPPVAGPQPTPPTLITLPPHSPFIGGGPAPSTTTPAPAAPAPDTIPIFPPNLSDSISNPLIVLDAFADAPEIGAIPVIHTATFSTGDFGELGTSNGSGSGGGTHWHGSLSETSVESMPSIPTPDATPVSIDLPGETLEVHAAANQSFTLTLPVMIGAEGLPVSADAHVELRLADGRPLPGWLHYDPVRGTLSGKVPANQRALNVAIIAHDAAGHQTRREVAIDFGGHPAHAEHPAAPAVHAPQAPHAAAPLAKPSLAEQFARAHATLHVARPTAAPTVALAAPAAVGAEGGRA
ncbi:DUF4347 domain-containing protein [Paraburkholderia caffeinilytica]|uniref:DUF4347 domain-containing protein n=1 Tax=Paraburkholderia caffeinilytica TaxID=1761016 RepID=UPI0038BDB0E9